MRVGFLRLERVVAGLLAAGLLSGPVAVLARDSTAASRPSDPACHVHMAPVSQGSGTMTAERGSALASQVAGADACKLVPGVKVATLADLWASLVGDTRIGGKRFETPVPPGTPAGTMMLGSEGVTFDFRSVQSEGLQGFELVDRSTGHRLAKVRSPRPLFTLPLPGRDHRYGWVMVTGARTYRADFDVLDAADQSAVEARLRRIDQAGLTPAARAFFRAAVFDDEGLYSARDAVLATLREEQLQRQGR